MYTPISYEEYIHELDYQREHQIGLFIKDDDRKEHKDSYARRRFFTAMLRWRDDVDTVRQGYISKAYGSFAELICGIDETRKLLEDTDRNEALKDRMWWECTWYEMTDDDTIALEYFSLDADGYLQSFGTSFDFSKTRWEKLFADTHYITNPHNVIPPFKPGDIVKVDARPFGKPFFAVWGANSDTPGVDEEFPFIYRCGDNPILGAAIRCQVDDIYFPDGYIPLDRISREDIVEDSLLLETASQLKENPALWQEWTTDGHWDHLELKILQGKGGRSTPCFPRDPTRIEPFLDKIGELWKKYPDLRFGQLLLNVFEAEQNTGRSFYYMDEQEMLRIICSHYGGMGAPEEDRS